MELKSNCHTIELIEREIINSLIRNGQARMLKDASKSGEDGKPDKDGRKFYTKHLTSEKEYNIYVGVAWQFAIEQVYVRLWYDHRNNTAGIKISMEGFMLIANSVTVTNLLKKLNEKLTVNGNKNIDLDKISQVMKTAIRTIDKDAEVTVEARQTIPDR